jgi:hypothetical protein
MAESNRMAETTKNVGWVNPRDVSDRDEFISTPGVKTNRRYRRAAAMEDAAMPAEPWAAAAFLAYRELPGASEPARALAKSRPEPALFAREAAPLAQAAAWFAREPAWFAAKATPFAQESASWAKRAQRGAEASLAMPSRQSRAPQQPAARGGQMRRRCLRAWRL